jgi:hypothetical protein
MDGIADMGGVVDRSATYALASEVPALAERGEGPTLASPSACNRLTACGLHASRCAVKRCQLTHCGSILAEAVTVHAQELSDRPTDNDRGR